LELQPPDGITSETEDLPAVTMLEVNIIPDMRRGEAPASLAQLQLAYPEHAIVHQPASRI
jgi:hypothetical protein